MPRRRLAPEPPSAPIPNLGPVSRRWLAEVGLHTLADLRRLGPVAAFQLVRRRQPRATLNLLWALAAALDGLDWRALDAHRKDQLRRQLDPS